MYLAMIVNSTITEIVEDKFWIYAVFGVVKFKEIAGIFNLKSSGLKTIVFYVFETFTSGSRILLVSIQLITIIPVNGSIQASRTFPRNINEIKHATATAPIMYME